MSEPDAVHITDNGRDVFVRLGSQYELRRDRDMEIARWKQRHRDLAVASCLIVLAHWVIIIYLCGKVAGAWQ